MRSFATTRIPRNADAIPLWLVVRGDDHPKACTGRRLLRQGTVRRSPRGYGSGHEPIALDPYSRAVLSGRDRVYAERCGLLVVDCSWNLLSARGRLLENPDSFNLRRRLPFLLVTNPQHFGRVGQLNSAEAFAAALTILGHEAQGRELLAPFHGAEAFFELNADRLGSYRQAENSRSALAAERIAFSEQ